MRNYSLIDRILLEADQALRTVHTRTTSERPSPAPEDSSGGDTLSGEERQLAARLMRVNHAGEVAAQGLYRGQALTAKDDQTRQQMEKSASEETDHLAWCEQRISELGGQKSLLGPLWYGGSFAIGALAGLLGDRWSLGFVRETEQQVEQHLSGHLERLPASDRRSRAILDQMRVEEAEHGKLAAKAGAAELPAPVKSLMTLVSRAMTTTAYRF